MSELKTSFSPAISTSDKDETMYYSKLLFGKEHVSDIQLEDVKAYFAETKEESDRLEFKSYAYPTGFKEYSPDREKGVLKSICAMLNSEGGIVIWGAPTTERQKESNQSFTKGPLQPVPFLHEKDAFIAKIANRITPSPRNVLFHRIEDEKKYIYLFDISASEHSPHQFENIYYMRMDGQTVAAPHAYIEALFRKIRYPAIEGYLMLSSYHFASNSDTVKLAFNILFRNRTPLINDENLYCKIITNPGGIYSAELPGYVPEVNYKNISEVISYGNPVYQSFGIHLSRIELKGCHDRVVVTMIFGGRFSPVRICQYSVQIGPSCPENLQHCIEPIQENVYLHELNQMGKLDDDLETFLKKIGRK